MAISPQLKPTHNQPKEMKAVKNMQVCFADSKSIATFEVPNRANCVDNQHSTYLTSHKAGPWRQFCLRSFARFGDFRKGSASFVIYLLNFFLTMPNREKVSKTAQGARATKPYSTLKSEEKKSLIYKASQDLFAKSKNVRIFVVRNDAICIHKVHTTRLIRRCLLSTFSYADSIVSQKQWGQRFLFAYPTVTYFTF